MVHILNHYLLMVNFFIIGGWSKNSHHIWNHEENNQSLQEIHKFNINELNYHSALYIKSKQAVLIITGNNVGKLYLYSLKTNKCKELKIELIKPLFIAYGSVITSDERYVIMFGYEIQIFDLYSNSIRMSNISPPEKNVYRAIIISDKYQTEIVTSGYIKNVYKQINMALDLIKLIQSFCLTEIVHLFGVTHRGHWKLSIDKILE